MCFQIIVDIGGYFIYKLITYHLEFSDQQYRIARVEVLRHPLRLIEQLGIGRAKGIGTDKHTNK
jgi:hypothetical protein